MKETLQYIIIVVIVLLLGYGGWKAERYINWKFSYGNKVEKRIKQLESKVEILENYHKNK